MRVRVRVRVLMRMLLLLPTVVGLNHQPPVMCDTMHVGGEAGWEVVAARQEGGDVLQRDAWLPSEEGIGPQGITVLADLVGHAARGAGPGAWWTPGGRTG